MIIMIVHLSSSKLFLRSKLSSNLKNQGKHSYWVLDPFMGNVPCNAKTGLMPFVNCVELLYSDLGSELDADLDSASDSRCLDRGVPRVDSQVSIAATPLRLKASVWNFYQNFNIHTLRCDFLCFHFNAPGMITDPPDNNICAQKLNRKRTFFNFRPPLHTGILKWTVISRPVLAGHDSHTLIKWCHL